MQDNHDDNDNDYVKCFIIGGQSLQGAFIVTEVGLYYRLHQKFALSHDVKFELTWILTSLDKLDIFIYLGPLNLLQAQLLVFQTLFLHISLS